MSQHHPWHLPPPFPNPIPGEANGKRVPSVVSVTRPTQGCSHHSEGTRVTSHQPQLIKAAIIPMALTPNTRLTATRWCPFISLAQAGGWIVTI